MVLLLLNSGCMVTKVTKVQTSRVPQPQEQLVGVTTKKGDAAPGRKSGMERTVFLHSRGWYQLHLRDNSEPDNATFARIMTVPGAAVQFAADRFKEWRQGTLR
jgi:hypothetical protein